MNIFWDQMNVVTKKKIITVRWHRAEKSNAETAERNSAQR